MKHQPVLTSIRKHGDEMTLHNLQRVHRTLVIGYGDADQIPAYRDVELNTWRGMTQEGHSVHIVFHGDELTIEVDLPTARGSQPLTIMRWNPLRILPLIRPLVEEQAKRIAAHIMDYHAVAGPLPGTDPNARLADMRALQARHDGTLGDYQLFEWLEFHNKHFGLLASNGLAGSRIRFCVVTPISKPMAA